jgi:hypothetical protein
VQVEREAAQVGAAVCDATDQAVRRAAAEGTSRAISEQLGKQLAALSAEVGKLETRARAASRAIAEQRRGDRVLLYGLAAAVLIANVLTTCQFGFPAFWQSSNPTTTVPSKAHCLRSRMACQKHFCMAYDART